MNSVLADSTAGCDESVYVDPLSGHKVHICATTSCTSTCAGGTTPGGPGPNQNTFTCICPGQQIDTGRCELQSGCAANESYSNYNPVFVWMGICPTSGTNCMADQVCFKMYEWDSAPGVHSFDPPDDPFEGYTVDCECVY